MISRSSELFATTEYHPCAIENNLFECYDFQRLKHAARFLVKILQAIYWMRGRAATQRSCNIIYGLRAQPIGCTWGGREARFRVRGRPLIDCRCVKLGILPEEAENGGRCSEERVGWNLKIGRTEFGGNVSWARRLIVMRERSRALKLQHHNVGTDLWRGVWGDNESWTKNLVSEDMVVVLGGVCRPDWGRLFESIAFVQGKANT